MIIWDRLFGTFQNEDERPSYGLVKNLPNHNLFSIAFHEWKSILNDISKAPDLKSGLGYVFGPPGWSHDGSRKTTRQLRREALTKRYR
jgi:hypothetical protein